MKHGLGGDIKVWDSGLALKKREISFSVIKQKETTRNHIVYNTARLGVGSQINMSPAGVGCGQRS